MCHLKFLNFSIKKFWWCCLIRTLEKELSFTFKMIRNMTWSRQLYYPAWCLSKVNARIKYYVKHGSWRWIDIDMFTILCPLYIYWTVNDVMAFHGKKNEGLSDGVCDWWQYSSCQVVVIIFHILHDFRIEENIFREHKAWQFSPSCDTGGGHTEWQRSHVQVYRREWSYLITPCNLRQSDGPV